nr:MAG: hypothetical protein [Bacteriophage sp.]
MKEPFNSQAPHFLTKVKTYCAKVLPLVFDNSLSYYEFLGKVCHKLNECIDALNSQNLNIIEFTHMVQLEIENFEKYIDNRITEFEDELKKAWEEYKEELNKAFADFKNEMLAAWEEEKAINEKFRTDLLNDFNSFKTEITAQQERFETQIKADFNTYKETVNAEIEQFEQATNADLSAFKNTMQTQQNEFENHMVELFNNFKTTEKQARTDFESNFQQLFEQWKIDTLYALNENISDWETDTQNRLTAYIDEKIGAFQAGFNAKVNQLEIDLNKEREDRRQHDESLQTQINQLTPEGAIKADSPDSNGNSQLYTINPDTQERTDIFPKVNDSGDSGDLPENVVTAGEPNKEHVRKLSVNGEDFLPKGEITPVRLTPNNNTNESYLLLTGLGRGVMRHKLCAIDNTPFVKLKGITDLGNGFISIPKANLGYSDTSAIDAKNVLTLLQIDFLLYVDEDPNNIIAKAGLRFNLYWARWDGDNWKCGVQATGFNATEGLAAVNSAILITKVNLINYG